MRGRGNGEENRASSSDPVFAGILIDYRLFDGYHMVHRRGHQTEQRNLFFTVVGDETSGYIDLAACMTAANRKQYHQVTGDGNPLAYRCTVVAIKGPLKLFAAQMGFITGNAVKMTAQGWLAQMKHANIKRKDLPKYGKRPRFALESGAWTVDTAFRAGASITGISALHLQPMHGTDIVTDLYIAPGGYLASDGMQVFYRTQSPTALGKVCANMISTVVTPGEIEEPLVLLGNAPNEFNVIDEYRSGRRSAADVDVSDTIPEGDMSNLFSIAEESSDEIEAGLEEYMDWTPFVPDQVLTNPFDELTQVADVSNATSASIQYPPIAGVFDAPLGLLKIDAAETNVFEISVEAIYEM